MTDFKWNNGDKVKDSVTGFVGIIIGRIDWLYGCRRYCVQGLEMKDGVPTGYIYLDENQIEVVKAGAVKGFKAPIQMMETPRTVRTGGPRDDPRHDGPKG